MINWTKPTIESVFPKPAYTAATGADCLERWEELDRDEALECWREHGHGSADE